MSGLKEVPTDQVYEKEDVSLAALQIVIDGVACSEATKLMRHAGVYITGLIMADMKAIWMQKAKAILSIIEMASEADSPCFKL